MKEKLLRELPSVDELLRSASVMDASGEFSLSLMTSCVRAAIDEARSSILAGNPGSIGANSIADKAVAIARRLASSKVRRVVNASGTVIHTNIGRAVLSDAAADAVGLAASNNVNLEFDLEKGERGERDSLVEGLVVRLTGAEAACVVNNNAAAVLITLNTLAEGRDVVISRGELIEIGGSFRLPEIIRKSGCTLKEVGTTNRTHPSDYTGAAGENTALFLKAHTSNYTVVGFTAEVGLKELAALAAPRGITVVEDLGSGCIVDLSKWGLTREPLVKDSIEAGADIVTFSGDKLLGGPQAGIIAGKKPIVDKIRQNPLKRALRADKLTLSALEATLRLYLNPETLAERLPTLRHLARPIAEIEKAAIEAKRLLEEKLGKGYRVEMLDAQSEAGAGSLPGVKIPTKALSVTHPEAGAGEIFRRFLSSNPPILGRVHRDMFLLDLRTVDCPADVVPV